jgi:hypothetical protein
MNSLSNPRVDRRTCLKGAIGLLAAQRLVAQPSFLFAQTSTAKQQMTPPSLKESLNLAGQNLIAVLNPEENYLPYWELQIQRNYRAHLCTFWPAHNLGRWLDAMFRLQEAIGFEIPQKIEQAMLANTQRFFDNPDRICVNPDPYPLHPRTLDKGLQWDLHSLREGLLALNAWARWRKNAWAADMGRQMVESLSGKLKPDGAWDLDKFDARQKRGPEVIHNLAPSDTHGRMLEALVWFYETTGDPASFALANRLAEWHYENTTQEDGRINPAGKVDHTHSYFGTLRGLLLFGQLTHQRKYVERVASAYRETVTRVVKESGYTSHNIVVESIGETTSPGDAAQLALWLARHGYSEFLDDADRLVRSRILPSQILATRPLEGDKNFGNDASTDLERRMIGAYGGCHRHPHGSKTPVTDVTAADVHTLVDIYQNIVNQRGELQEVLFHLNYEDPRIAVVCKRDEKAELTVVSKTATSLAIRVPKWTPRNTLVVRINGQAVEPVYAGNFLHTGKVPAGAHVSMQYDLPERTTRETDLGVEYAVHWKGDDVKNVEPNTDFYPMYPYPA